MELTGGIVLSTPNVWVSQNVVVSNWGGEGVLEENICYHFLKNKMSTTL
jgi:hypothetical protein